MTKKSLLFLLLTFAFTLQTRAQARLDAHHWLVDAQAKTTSEYVFPDFDSLNKAISERNADSLVVYVKPWVYWIDDPDDSTIRRGDPPIGMTVKCRSLTLIGLGKDPDETVLACQRGQSQGADGNFTMFDFHCDSLSVSNLTFGDYLNVDLDYKLHPELSRKKRSNTITQGQIAFMKGRFLKAERCRFVSRLNLCPIIGADNSLYDSCHFESTDDALNGNATYTHCDFDFYGSRPLYTTFGHGATFIGCQFNVKHGGSQYFCKSPGKVKVVNCRFNAPEGTYIGWTPVVPAWLRCYQAGNNLFIDSKHPSASACKGSGTYKALNINSNISTHSATLRTGKDSLLLQAKVTTVENKEMPIKWTIEKGFEPFVSIRADKGTCLVVPANYSAEEKRLCVTASSGDSLAVEVCQLTIEPAERAVPTFSSKPEITIKEGKARLYYQLNLQGTTDESVVVWLRNEADGKLTEVGRSSIKPLLVYRLRPSDVGHKITARVYPKSNCSRLSEDFLHVTSRTVKASDLPCPYILESDFSDLPKLTKDGGHGNWSGYRYKPDDTSAYEWTKDNPSDFQKPWRYGHGTGGCRDSLGLVQTIQGSRLVYRPKEGSYGNEQLTLEVTPAKTAGQGFSSNRMQYMDVCIKYDNRTMTGYGLRIIRTLKYGNAVDFTLMAFHNGKAEPVSETVSSTCYRGNVTITLNYNDGILTAEVTTDAKPSVATLPNEVSLKAKVERNAYGDFVIQHTGTTGEGQTMLRHIRLRLDNAVFH